MGDEMRRYHKIEALAYELQQDGKIGWLEAISIASKVIDEEMQKVGQVSKGCTDEEWKAITKEKHITLTIASGK